MPPSPGDRFGRLVVVQRTPGRRKQGKARIMIGQHFRGTLWQVTYTYLRLASGDKPEHFTTGQRNILTADPGGADLLEVARMVELGSKPEGGRDFALQSVHRIGEVSGLGQLVGTDRGWPAGLDVGAVVLDASGRAQATIGDLRKALLLKDIAIAELEKQLYALQRGGEEPRA